MIYLTEDITLNLVIINYGKEEGAKFERLFLCSKNKRFSSEDDFLCWVRDDLSSRSKHKKLL